MVIVAVRLALFVGGALPWLSPFLPDSAARRALEAFFRFQCHGLADRVLLLSGRPMPVCSRCAGIYLGVALAAVLRGPPVSRAILRVWLLVAAGLMFIDALILQDRIPALRLATGLLLAVPAVRLLLGDARPEPASAA